MSVQFNSALHCRSDIIIYRNSACGSQTGLGSNIKSNSLLVIERSETISSKHSKTSFEKNCFSAWASTLNMGLINKVDMVCLSPVGYGV